MYTVNNKERKKETKFAQQTMEVKLGSNVLKQCGIHPNLTQFDLHCLLGGAMLEIFKISK